AQEADPSSVLNLYRRLLAARRRSPALRLGDAALLPVPEGVLAYERTLAGDRRAVVVNFADRPARVPLGGSWQGGVSGARPRSGRRRRGPRPACPPGGVPRRRERPGLPGRRPRPPALGARRRGGLLPDRVPLVRREAVPARRGPVRHGDGRRRGADRDAAR